MQKGLSWLQRRYLCRNPALNLATFSKCLGQGHRGRCFCIGRSTCVSLPKRFAHTLPTNVRDDIYTSEAVPFEKTGKNRLKKKAGSNKRNLPHVSATRIHDPEAWIELLNDYLPAELRVPAQKEQPLRLGNTSRKEICQQIVAILESARREQHTGQEILTYMIVHGRKDAALHIVSTLLNDIATRYPSRTSKLMPSGVQWPGSSVQASCDEPINLKQTDLYSVQPVQDWHERAEDPRSTFVLSDKKETAMTEIWSMLGTLVIEAANLPAPEASAANNAALLVLGQIHNLDLVPDNVYSYNHSPLATTIQRPPILHLVSSRILTTISDATWRQQQDRMIEQAANHGTSYQDIGRDPPGGRFRLKVRPLGPEIWLEFILWCCVEGGFSSAGTRIVRKLRAQDANPWFAITWSPNSGSSQTSPVIDWHRVRDRYGGAVGLKEGYSDDRPFVEMPSRTVSTEVILALVDVSINAINPVLMRGTGLSVVQRSIYELVTFLEPHDLPTSYFNYLAVRLMQADAFDLPDGSPALQIWHKRLASMKAMQTAQKPKDLEPSLTLDAISAFSEVTPGILHQALDGCIQSGNVHRALDIFNELQELVDLSKLQGIGTFLHDTAAKDEPALLTSGLPHNGNLKEFVRSHGQLPLYKITGLLELGTDTGLTGFVQWLLYNDGPDGPLVPQYAYQDPGLARVLLRYATANRDWTLLKDILDYRKHKTRKFSVNLVRALVNANIALLQFEQAVSHLGTLRKAQGGGLGLSNIAQIAAVILKLEDGKSYELSQNVESRVLVRGQRLLERMLSGKYNDQTGTFQVSVRKHFRQQIGAMLQVFQMLPDSSLSSIGAHYAERYPSANVARLQSHVFNYLMDAIVQCKGSAEGMRLWKLCCQSSSYSGHDFYKDYPLMDDEEAYDEAATAEGSNEEEVFDDDNHRFNLVDRTDHLPIASASEASLGQHRHETTPTVTDPSAEKLPPRDITAHDPHLFSSAELSNSFFPSKNIQETAVEDRLDQLVEPSQQTLRLIIRGAVRERENLLQLNANVDLQKSVLSWAAEELIKLGATPRMVSIEIGDSYKTSQIQQSRYQHYTLQDQQPESPIKIRRISSSFEGQQMTRPNNVHDHV